MNPPDKIYRVFGKDTYIDVEDQPASENYCEYISKDAILEWAKKHQCEQGFEDGEAEHGYQVAIRDLIRDIESL